MSFYIGNMALTGVAVGYAEVLAEVAGVSAGASLSSLLDAVDLGDDSENDAGGTGPAAVVSYGGGRRRKKKRRFKDAACCAEAVLIAPEVPCPAGYEARVVSCKKRRDGSCRTRVECEPSGSAPGTPGVPFPPIIHDPFRG